MGLGGVSAQKRSVIGVDAGHLFRGLRNSLAMLAQTVLAHCTNAPHPLQRRLVIGERWFCMSRAPNLYPFLGNRSVRCSPIVAAVMLGVEPESSGMAATRSRAWT